MKLTSLAALLGAAFLTLSVSSAKTPARPASSIEEIEDLNKLPGVLAGDIGMRTLLVLDIDDTLLTSPGFFGSDSWYEWQKKLPKDHPDKIHCLYDFIAMNYESGAQMPTQPDAPSIINSLNVDKIIQTSRSLAARMSTIRELLEAGYTLPAPLSEKIDGKLFLLDPAKPDSPAISYHRGLFMGAGSDKGTLLSRLMDDGSLKYDRVVFVDDAIRNIESMRVAMESKGIVYRGLFYTRISKEVTPDKERLARQGWVEWQHLLALTFPERGARIAADQCGYK